MSYRAVLVSSFVDDSGTRSRPTMTEVGPDSGDRDADHSDKVRGRVR